MREMGSDVFITGEQASQVDIHAEIGRLAGVMEKLVALTGNAGMFGPATTSNVYSERIDVQIARKLTADRTARNKFLGDDLSAEPIWDILLDLYVAGKLPRDVSVSSSCIASRVPATTALRCQNALKQSGAIIRTADPSDGRKFNLTLAPAIENKIAAYLRSLSPVQVSKQQTVRDTWKDECP
jgi:hypothetical protein